MIATHCATRRNRLALALLAVMCLPGMAGAQAQDTTPAAETRQEAPAKQAETGQVATEIDRVVVTGSLIPQSEVETFQPLTVITADQIQARGFTSVSEAIRETTMSTGGADNAQTSSSFTQGAETMSMFSLRGGYTKFLVDGRPMVAYPALYGGTDMFNNISGIPIDLVERIEILPGGQSSLYGADALAGVVNIILKKEMDGTALTFRGGAHTGGGGGSMQFSAATGFQAAEDRLNVLLGLSYGQRDPIWAHQRALTRQFNLNGSSPPEAGFTHLIYGEFTGLHLLDPNNCAGVSGMFAGTTGMQAYPGVPGNYCGSMYTPGYRTLQNGKEGAQFYGHATLDVGETGMLYADAMYSHENVAFAVGPEYTWWGTPSTPFAYFYDPNLDDLITLKRTFAPEEMGGYDRAMTRNTSDTYAVTVGYRGEVFGSWDLDVNASRTEYKLKEDQFVRWAQPMNQWFKDNVLGPQLGWDPYFGQPIYAPDYAKFYTMMDPAVFASMTGRAVSRSRTWDNQVRAQLTNTHLFALPGGDAGAAFAAEWARESWAYRPHPGYFNGDIWGWTSIGASQGARSRHAVIGELRLPVLTPLTVTTSARYDRFGNLGGDIGKLTYSLGLEYRPFEQLLLRGKYGNAFRAVSLADQYQASSGSYGWLTDYYGCWQAGFDPANPSQLAQCPPQVAGQQAFVTTQGSGGLKPINADVWSAGLVWAPLQNLSFSLDYFSWEIRDEISATAASALLFTEYRCYAGIEDLQSPTCQDALGKIERDGSGRLLSVHAPKVNVARQSERAGIAAVHYQHDAGRYGVFSLDASVTQIFRHDYLRFVGDIPQDWLNDPNYSSDPKRKADLSLNWAYRDISATLYANWQDKTPNYAAITSNLRFDAPDAGWVSSHTRLNLNLSWKFLPQHKLSLSVNNLLNTMPPRDPTVPGWFGAPYNSYNYTPYGRSILLEWRYTGKQH